MPQQDEPIQASQFHPRSAQREGHMTEYTLTAINDWQPGRRYAFDKEAEKVAAADIVDSDFWEFLEKVWDYSAASTVTLYNFYSALRHVLDQAIEGDVIECGVFFGGTIMLAAHVLKKYNSSSSRRLIAMDTFTGFVRRDTLLDIDYDGVAVCHTTEDPNGAGFFEVASSNMRSVGFDRTRYREGRHKRNNSAIAR